MKNIVKLTTSLALVAGSALAASNNATVSSNVNPYMIPPVTGYISGTITSTTAPVLLALPSTSKTVTVMVCRTRDSNGNIVPRNIVVSGSDIAVSSATGQASGTLAVGDQVSCVLNYQR